jgi:hypothetical protein
MAHGTGEARIGLGEYGDTGNRALQKKSSLTDPKEVRLKVEHILSLLRCHKSAQLFLDPLDPNHPKYNELQADFINLIKIELNFRSGKYSSTF